MNFFSPSEYFCFVLNSTAVIFQKIISSSRVHYADCWKHILDGEKNLKIQLVEITESQTSGKKQLTIILFIITSGS